MTFPWPCEPWINNIPQTYLLNDIFHFRNSWNETRTKSESDYPHRNRHKPNFPIEKDEHIDIKDEPDITVWVLQEMWEITNTKHKNEKTHFGKKCTGAGPRSKKPIPVKKHPKVMTHLGFCKIESRNDTDFNEFSRTLEAMNLIFQATSDKGSLLPVADPGWGPKDLGSTIK